MRAKLGQGRASKRLAVMVTEAAKFYFSTEDITNVEIHPVPPVWRRPCFDVMLVEGLLYADGYLRLFASWESVTALLKYRKVRIDGGDRCLLEIWPDYETLRAKK